MAANDLMDPKQSAHRKGHSTETALLRVHNDIISAVDKGNDVILVLLDLSATFDTVDHRSYSSSLKNMLVWMVVL